MIDITLEMSCAWLVQILSGIQECFAERTPKPERLTSGACMNLDSLKTCLGRSCKDRQSFIIYLVLLKEKRASCFFWRQESGHQRRSIDESWRQRIAVDLVEE